MKRAGRVEAPDPRGDRPSGAKLASTALVGLALGVMLSLASSPRASAPIAPREAVAVKRVNEDAGLQPSATEARSATRKRRVETNPAGPIAEPLDALGHEPDDDAGAPAQALPGASVFDAAIPLAEVAPSLEVKTSPAESEPLQAHAGDVADAQADAPSAQAEPKPARQSRAEAERLRAGPAREPRAGLMTQLRLKTGTVAYLRCTGLPQRNGPHPCPRDPKLESSVWNALRTLERCDGVGLGRGPGQVRYEFTRAGVAKVEVRARGQSFDEGAVERCAGAALARVRTTLRAVHLIVAFRFQLESAAVREPNSGEP